MEWPWHTLRRLERRLASVEATAARLASQIDPRIPFGAVPTPIAEVVAREVAEVSFDRKFLALLDICEAFLKYTSGIAFAVEIRAGGVRSEEILRAFLKPPSLGILAGELRKCLDGPTTAWPLDIIRSDYRKDGSKTPLERYLLEEFLKLRNDEKGHGSSQPEGYYEDLFLKNRLIVEDILKACVHLSIPLVNLGPADARDSGYVHSARLLMGLAPTAIREDIKAETPIPKGATCLWPANGQDGVISIDQFVSYLYCSVCNREHMFFAERIKGNEVSYFAPVGNHRLKKAVPT